MFDRGDLPAGADRGFPQSIGAEQPEQKRLVVVFVRRVHHAVGETGRRVRSVAEQFLDRPRLGIVPVDHGGRVGRRYERQIAEELPKPPTSTRRDRSECPRRAPTGTDRARTHHATRTCRSGGRPRHRARASSRRGVRTRRLRPSRTGPGSIVYLDPPRHPRRAAVRRARPGAIRRARSSDRTRRNKSVRRAVRASPRRRGRRAVPRVRRGGSH